MLALAPLLAGVGCAGLPGAPTRAACPVVPVASDDLPRPLLLRTRMQVSAGDRSLRVETVAETSDEGLVVLGFAPYGVRLFAVRQREGTLAPEWLAASELRSPALWAADILHRVYWIQPPGRAAPDGRTRWSREGERVTDWREQGLLRRREFERQGADPSASERVSIEYPDDPDTDGAPGISIRNPWCGYEALVVTLED